MAPDNEKTFAAVEEMLKAAFAKWGGLWAPDDEEPLILISVTNLTVSPCAKFDIEPAVLRRIAATLLNIADWQDGDETALDSDITDWPIDEE